MALLVIRLRAEFVQGEWDRAVHLAVTPDGGIPGTLVSVCNQLFESYEIELLPAVTGFPCDVCLHNNALSETADAAMATEWEPSPHPRTPQLVEAVAGQAAVGFNNPGLLHRVPEKPLTSVFDGRTVVIAVCGLLAYPVLEYPSSSVANCDGCDG